MLLTFEACALCTYLLSVTVSESEQLVETTAQTVLENEFLRVSIDPASGRLSRIMNKEDGVDLPVDQGFYWYAFILQDRFLIAKFCFNFNLCYLLCYSGVYMYND